MRPLTPANSGTSKAIEAPAKVLSRVFDQLAKRELLAILDFIVACQGPARRSRFFEALSNLSREVLLCERITVAACAQGVPSVGPSAERCRKVDAVNVELKRRKLPAGDPNGLNGRDDALNGAICTVWCCTSDRNARLLEISRDPSAYRACIQPSDGSRVTCLASYSNSTIGIERASTILPCLFPHIEEAYRHISEDLDEVEESPSGEPLVTVPADPMEKLQLTPRQTEILRWIAHGKGNWETGAILDIAERTVKFHLQNIFRKLNVVNRTQAVAKAVASGLL